MNRERLKGVALGAAASVLVAGLSMTAFASSRSITVSDGIRVMLNGEAFQPKDGNGAPVELFSYNGTIYAPVRAICEAAGMEVSYDSKTMTAHITARSEQPAREDATSKPAAQDSTLIDEARAKQIALKHAKVNESDAVFTEVKLSKGFGSAQYELEFRSGASEYDYKIDAVSGNILKFDQEYHDDYKTQTTTSGTITAERAKEIALERAPGASVTKCKLDSDDGVYEIDLRSGFTKYECEIDISTGKIVKWETDD